jgi:hypothetical protein
MPTASAPITSSGDGWRSGRLRFEQQMPDLRAVAEGQHELVRTSERHECRGGCLQVAALHVGGDLFAPARERVPAQCSDDAHLTCPG